MSTLQHSEPLRKFRWIFVNPRHCSVTTFCESGWFSRRRMIQRLYVSNGCHVFLTKSYRSFKSLFAIILFLFLFYFQYCLSSQKFTDDFNATRDCQFGRNISNLQQAREWPNSSLSEVEFSVQTRLPVSWLLELVHIFPRNISEALFNTLHGWSVSVFECERRRKLSPGARSVSWLFPIISYAHRLVYRLVNSIPLHATNSSHIRNACHCSARCTYVHLLQAGWQRCSVTNLP